MRFFAFVFLTASIVSCSRPPPDATPEGALREWIARMDAQVSDPHEARSAYALLSKGTHQGLEKRAERASRIEGHRIDASEILAQGRFALHFPPRKLATTITGDAATVDVTGDDPTTEHATVHLVKEGPSWHVDLALPELLDLPHRPETTGN